jgi:hypothetical protein
MSYAEMEGLDLAEAVHTADEVAIVRADAAATRWLVLVGAVTLSAAATVVATLLLARG